MTSHFLAFVGATILAASGVGRAIAAEPLVENLYPAGGGHFAISLSACNGTTAQLNGALANNTDTIWLYVEVQLKVTIGNSTSTYRLNLERIGPKGITIRQRLEGAANQDCDAIRLSGLELISAYSETRAAAKKQ